MENSLVDTWISTMGLSDCSRLLYHWAISPSAPPGNSTRVARMGILHDTTTPAALISEINRFNCHKLYARLDKIINLWKNYLGDTGIWTMGLSDCCRLLYNWAISPSAPPRNWTRVARMGILHDTTSPATLISETIRFNCHKLYASLDKIINLWKTI